MKLIVCAKSEQGRFIGLPSASGYTVFSADDADAIHPGDVLTNPTWDQESVPAPNVKNLTTGEHVKVRLEQWEMTFPQARDVLENGTVTAITWHPPWPGI